MCCGKLTHPFIPSPHFCEDMFLEGNQTCPRLRSGKRLKFLSVNLRPLFKEDVLFEGTNKSAEADSFLHRHYNFKKYALSFSVEENLHDYIEVLRLHD